MRKVRLNGGAVEAGAYLTRDVPGGAVHGVASGMNLPPDAGGGSRRKFTKPQ